MARPRKQTYTMKQYMDNLSEGYITNDVPIQRNPKWKAIIDGLVVTILTDDYIPAIILAEEEGGGRTVIVDGGSRTAAFKEICKGNYKIKSSVEDPIIEYKKREIDEDGNISWCDAEFDIRNKTFDKFPKELQKRFYEYQVETVIHECGSEKIAKYFRRYNEHTNMNTNEKMFIHLPDFADKIKKITNREFFINYSDFTENEKNKGILERVISESVMCTFHFNKWNKNGKKLATYLNENASDTEFDKMNDNLSRLEKIVTETTKTLFNSKNTFIWLTLFNRFTELGISDEKFGDFLTEFVGGLRNKSVNGKLFDKADENGSTKDKAVIIDKLHILETLMKEYLHIEDDETENLSTEEFISKVVDMPVDTVKEEIEVYEEDLKSLQDNTIRDGSKLLEVANHLSLLAMVAYSYKNDVTLDYWLTEYAAKNNTYVKNQKQNYLNMLSDLNRYISCQKSA